MENLLRPTYGEPAFIIDLHFFNVLGILDWLMTGDLTLETFLFSNWSLNLISFSIDEITNKEREKEAYLHYFRIVEETEYYPDSVWKT